jgi:YVTN family beta-propeller protein
MNIESASRTGPRSLVADDHAMSAEAFRGLSCRRRTLVILGIVLLAGCGGEGSQQPLVTPTISTISPNTAVAGGAAFTLTINGTNFVAASMVNFGGSAPATTFVNSTQLTAAIPASGIVSTGTSAVTVTNSAPGGGTSNPVNFTITSGGPSSVPAINFVSPSCVPAGEQFVDGVDNQLVVVGANFVPSSVLRWNGTDRPTTFDNNNGTPVLFAQISVSDFALAGTAAVTVFNPPPGGGTSNSVTFTTTAGGVHPQSIAVDPAGKFAYVANSGCDGGAGGNVSMYTIDLTTGALASVGPPVFSQDVGTNFVAIDPLGKFAYATSSGLFDTDGSVSTFAINPTTGALTSTGGLTGLNPNFCCFNSIAADPSGKFAYLTGAGGGVSSYAINGTTGALTSIEVSGAAGFAVSVAVDPSGKFAYVANQNTPGSAGNVSMYTINATTGALTSTGTIAAGINPAAVAVDPGGKFAYVTNSGSNDVSMYSIDVTTGALTSIGTIATGTDPVSIAVDPAGKFAYVVNFSSNDVSMYSIDVTTGALTSIGTIAAGQFPTSIAVHPSGKFAYVTNSGSNDVSMYSIDAATGALTLIGTIGT